MAKAPEKQTPGVYKRRIGDAMVTVINDGFLDIPFEILRGTGLDDMKGLMKATFRNDPPRLTVNAFVIETGKNTVLVDAGGGTTTVHLHHFSREARSGSRNEKGEGTCSRQGLTGVAVAMDVIIRRCAYFSLSCDAVSSLSNDSPAKSRVTFCNRTPQTRSR